jgi:hypothetical protein
MGYWRRVAQAIGFILQSAREAGTGVVDPGGAVLGVTTVAAPCDAGALVGGIMVPAPMSVASGGFTSL